MRRAIASSALIVGVVALTGCGGSSTSGPSGSGGGSGAVVQGQIVRTQGAGLKESVVVVVLRTALGIGLAEAVVGAPVVGATVNLLSGPTVAYTTTTSASGNFVFQGVLPGLYTIQVIDTTPPPPDTILTVAPPDTIVVVGDGDTATVAGQVTTANELGTVVTVAASQVENLNNAQLCHAIHIAEASGANVADVIADRQTGHGWGVVAQHFHAHPGVIGRHGDCSDADLAVASEAGGKGKGKGKKKGQS